MPKDKQLDIYTLSDLDAATNSDTINADIVIRGEHLKSIDNISLINGTLGISESSLESLGQLKEISGDFWTSFHHVFSPLTSLNKLERIGKDANFRYSNISDLGALLHVGGNLSLRDTPINSLGNLRFVGGNLFLPIRLKDQINLGNVRVIGRIQYWNDSKTKAKPTSKLELGLTQSSIPVPYWKLSYIYSTELLNQANPEQKKFYDYFKNSFLNNVFIDQQGNDNYSFILFYDLISSYYIHHDLKLLEKQFENLGKYYPITSNYSTSKIIEEFEKRNDFDSAWQFTSQLEYISIETIWLYEKKTNKQLLTPELIFKLSGYSRLTPFGQKNVNKLKPFIKRNLTVFEQHNNCSFFKLFFDEQNLYKANTNGQYSPDYYAKFFINVESFKACRTIDNSRVIRLGDNPLKYVVEQAILNQMWLITSNAEELYRESIGMPKVGEGWISETELFYEIKSAFSEFDVIHHGRPGWLGRQHFDIYIPELNIAIEYQGQQHYRPIDYFGGQEAFEQNKIRDKLKADKCKENNCTLIYVNEGYVLDTVVAQVKDKISNGA
jgi:hypothetical protein